jgi:hypothetical protein
MRSRSEGEPDSQNGQLDGAAIDVARLSDGSILELEHHRTSRL